MTVLHDGTGMAPRQEPQPLRAIPSATPSGVVRPLDEMNR